MIGEKTLLVRKGEVKKSGAKGLGEQAEEAKDAAKISGSILIERHDVAII